MTPLPLEVSHLRKTYSTKNGPLTAVKDLSLNVSPGECLGLLGPNGAGKTTAMNCMTGFYPVTSGEIRIFGRNVHKDPKAARASLGVCSQEDTLDTDFTVLDQMSIYGTYFGLKAKVSRARSQALLEKFHLAQQASSLVESLSGGMRRRVQVARALVHEPKLLILDEPTTGLDPEVRRDLWEMVAEYKKSGGAILLSTHYMEEAEVLCDRVALMRQGEIVDCETPGELIRKHVGVGNLEDVYMKIAGRKL